MTAQTPRHAAGRGGIETVLAGDGLQEARELVRSALIGETVLVVESEATIGEKLQMALEGAGAEVLVARTANEALARLAQFEFSAAVVEWRPDDDTREHHALVRRLSDDGVCFLYCAAELPDAAPPADDAQVLLKTAPAPAVVAGLARLTSAGLATGAEISSNGC